jgi:uncharacterized protein YjgD (DUF1641 family)
MEVGKENQENLEEQKDQIKKMIERFKHLKLEKNLGFA